MKLDDLKNELTELYKDLRTETRKSTVDYKGTGTDYNANKRKATIGIITGVLAYPFIPIVGIAAIGYGGMKVYQAYKDKKQGGGNNDRRNI